MSAWLRQHRLALAAAVRKWLSQRAAALLNALALGVALALPAGGYALLESLHGVSTHSAINPQLSVFMRTDADLAVTRRLEAQLRADPRIHRVRLITRAEALASLRGTSGLADVVAALGRNPLPDTLVVTAAVSTDDALDALARELGALPGVAQTQADALWARRLAALARVGRLMLALVAGVLAVGLIAITFNTIRLQILTQRDEIEVSKLIGATDGFIQRPFLYLGPAPGRLGRDGRFGDRLGGPCAAQPGNRDPCADLRQRVPRRLPKPGRGHDAGTDRGRARVAWGKYVSE